MKIQDRDNNDLRGATVVMIGTSLDGGAVGVALGLITKDGNRLELIIHEGEVFSPDVAGDSPYSEHLVPNVKH